jgi:hypothetical protein
MNESVSKQQANLTWTIIAPNLNKVMHRSPHNRLRDRLAVLFHDRDLMERSHG